MADEDIHTIWSIGHLILKLGPEKTIRELKKRCDAGAIIGCTLYKLLCDKWLTVSMEDREAAGRDPAESFLQAAGEDNWVERIEQLHTQYPGGIPKSIRFDLIDEFGLELEKKVGRRIPLTPEDATREDIETSKKIAASLSGMVTAPVKIAPPPQPYVETGKRKIITDAVKKLEKIDEDKESGKITQEQHDMGSVKAVEKAIEKAIDITCPGPVKPVRIVKSEQCDLMKEEIERKMEEIRRRRAEGGGGQAGESGGEYQKKGYSGVGAKSYAELHFLIGVCQDEARLKKLYGRIDSMQLNDFDKELLKEEISARMQKILEQQPVPECSSYDYYIKKVMQSTSADELPRLIDEVKGAAFLTDEEKRELVFSMRERIRILKGELVAEDKKEMSKEERITAARAILSTVEKKYEDYGEDEVVLTLDDISKIPREERVRLAKRIASGETAVREYSDVLTAPKNYTEWCFSDFEGLLQGVESIEDLESMYEYVGASSKLSTAEADRLRSMIKEKMGE